MNIFLWDTEEMSYLYLYFYVALIANILTDLCV